MADVEHQVRERAYYIWEDEGRVLGEAERHWLRAEREIHAGASPAPLLVQPVTPDLTLSASPAAVLGEALKAKPSRTRSVTAKVEAKVKAGAAPRAPQERTVKPAKAKAEKAAAAKPAALKSGSSKAAAAKAVDTKSAKAPKAVVRSRAVEAVATVH